MKSNMRVEVGREINVDVLLHNLQQDSKVTSIGASGYEVSVPKQLLQDSHDMIVELITTIELLNKELEENS